LIPSTRQIRGTNGGFTLVELLVAIGVITLLLALLLPVLAGARVQGQRIQGASNLRQMTMGFLNYAQDNKETLPASIVDTGGLPPYYVYHLSKGLDLRPVFRGYNLYPASAHPVLGKGPIESSNKYCPSFSTLNVIYVPWYYLPGYRMTLYPQTLQAAAPTRVHLAKSNHIMWSDLAGYDALGLSGPATYQMSQASEMTAYNGNGPDGVFAVWTDKPLGSYVAAYDGSVTFRPSSTLRWATYAAAGYQVGHAQPF
jgi:prepilin-type N-terminal cleavage/methylation domain-containing protein